MIPRVAATTAIFESKPRASGDDPLGYVYYF